MNNSSTSLEYRRASIQQASVVGLVMALHDTLIGNLRRAAEAVDKNDIQGRCAELVHGFKVLTQLDAMLDMKNGGETARKIRRFYTFVRGQMLEAQFKLSSKILRDQIRIVMEVRQAWEQVDGAQVEGQRTTIGVSTPQQGMMQAAPEAELRTAFSCSG